MNIFQTIYTISLLRTVAILLFVPSVGAFAQCDAEVYMTLCLANKDAQTNFLKAYKIEAWRLNEVHVEYSYVFTKNTLYHINLCTPNDEEGIVITIYDSRRNVLATHVVMAGVFTLTFHSASTGIYYVRYTFTGQRFKCGASVLSFSRPDKIMP